MWLKRLLVFFLALSLLSSGCFGIDPELQKEILNLEQELNTLGNYLQKLKENNENLRNELTQAKESLQTITNLYREQKTLIEEQQKSYKELNERYRMERIKSVVFMLATVMVSTVWMVERLR